MTPEVMKNFPEKYMKEMTMVGDNAYSVPCFMDILAFWVDEEKIWNKKHWKNLLISTEL